MIEEFYPGDLVMFNKERSIVPKGMYFFMGDVGYTCVRLDPVHGDSWIFVDRGFMKYIRHATLNDLDQEKAERL